MYSISQRADAWPHACVSRLHSVRRQHGRIPITSEAGRDHASDGPEAGLCLEGCLEAGP